ncbi:CBS domain-containing protein [Rhizobium sp. P32RR-XVIII]|uniref:CBS domain-containing protein n=1 Tax=Rhizobium sp. P32RR-XVIII TaxID=2726738 RepID=UPI0014569D3A|nr:CBS domain-containing protein [Rhizobium sp. P32RR-XVIII]NLS08238.1 CBS domain-containing protein [Rhizobium sp. P32RR-XVIII]
MLAKDVMTLTVVTLEADHSIRRAIEIMVAHRIGALPVISRDDTLIGIVTEGDLLRRIGSAKSNTGLKTGDDRTMALREYIKTRSWCVKDVMTRELITAKPETPVGHIADLMLANSIKHVPILDRGRIAGIVSRSNLLQALLSPPADCTASGDEALHLAVCTRLLSELNLQPERVHVVVSNCKVTLTGDVDSELERVAARVAAESVRGISGVVNELVVPSQRSQPSFPGD